MNSEVINMIEVRHVKGIEHLKISCDIFPNKPNFLVAPNGSGKSSLAIAFDSLNKEHLKLDEVDLHCDRQWDDSSVAIRFAGDEAPLVADKYKNKIAKKVSVFVIHSGLYANSVNKNSGKYVLNKTKLSLRNRVLLNKIPEACNLAYSIAEQRKSRPKVVADCMYNFKEALNDVRFLHELTDARFFDDMSVKPRNRGYIEEALDGFQEQPDRPLDASKLEKIAAVGGIKDVLEKHFQSFGHNELWINAVVLNDFLSKNKADVKKYFARRKYLADRERVDELLASVNRTREKMRTRETKGKLVISFPDWDDASNGELDVLQLCADLACVWLNFGTKDKIFMVIDEVFDYLDEANLIIAQYFLLGMMNEAKGSGKQLYAVIFTHLDPSLLESYRFKNPHISYIATSPSEPSGPLYRLLKDRWRCQREQKEVYDFISSTFLHYSCEVEIPDNVSNYLQSKDVPPKWLDPVMFREDMRKELMNYLRLQKSADEAEGGFDVLKVCCGLRVLIEECLYESLVSVEDKEAYLAIDKGTEGRIDFAQEHGVEVKETAHLLGGLYNRGMHVKGASGELSMLHRQLSNNIIKAMIEDLVKWMETRAAVSDA